MGMSTATTPTTAVGPAPLEILGPVTRVPSLDELRRLTDVPDRRVVYRNVAWAFYEELVDSIPESSNIHADYDGSDLEVMATGRKHEMTKKMLGRLVETTAEEFDIPYRPAGQATWKRPEIARGLEADECYYFLPEKLAADAAALERDSKEIADYPNPDLAIEVDISRPEIDRAGIYSALRVAEIWRFENDRVIIERLTPDGTYVAVESSGFLPLRAEEIRRWIVEEDWRDLPAWARRLRAEMKRKRGTWRGARAGAGEPSDSSVGPAVPVVQG
jgi:Uma2 family endonuclease